MTLEQLSLSTGPVGGEIGAVPPSNCGGGGVKQGDGGGDEGSKTPRLPRWTRQEILVLIQGKRVAENRVRRGRSAGLTMGSGQVEPKWASVSSYCKRHGVNRGPVQCRKRWSNLAGDFKKIKEWESQIKEESESFWIMRNDLRRERKLPGFFDKEVYDILNGAAVSASSPGLGLALAPAERDGGEGMAAEVGGVAEEAVFDSGRRAAADDGLFSDFEQSGQDETGRNLEKEMPLPLLEKEVLVAATTFPGPMPISEQQYQPFPSSGGAAGQGPQGNKQQPSQNAEFASTSQEGRKRKRFTTIEGDVEAAAAAASLEDQLIQVLERNGRILNAQLEAQNTNLKLDREERKDHASSLVAVLNKLADALGQIADKL
ncbi:hypothetical protein Dimus_015393 [Dionaea muscipula]